MTWTKTLQDAEKQQLARMDRETQEQQRVEQDMRELEARQRRELEPQAPRRFWHPAAGWL